MAKLLIGKPSVLSRLYDDNGVLKYRDGTIEGAIPDNPIIETDDHVVNSGGTSPVIIPPNGSSNNNGSSLEKITKKEYVSISAAYTADDSYMPEWLRATGSTIEIESKLMNNEIYIHFYNNEKYYNYKYEQENERMGIYKEVTDETFDSNTVYYTVDNNDSYTVNSEVTSENFDSLKDNLYFFDSIELDIGSPEYELIYINESTSFLNDGYPIQPIGEVKGSMTTYGFDNFVTDGTAMEKPLMFLRDDDLVEDESINMNLGQYGSFPATPMSIPGLTCYGKIYFALGEYSPVIYISQEDINNDDSVVYGSGVSKPGLYLVDLRSEIGMDYTVDIGISDKVYKISADYIDGNKNVIYLKHVNDSGSIVNVYTCDLKFSEIAKRIADGPVEFRFSTNTDYTGSISSPLYEHITLNINNCQMGDGLIIGQTIFKPRVVGNGGRYYKEYPDLTEYEFNRQKRFYVKTNSYSYEFATEWNENTTYYTVEYVTSCLINANLFIEKISNENDDIIIWIDYNYIKDPLVVTCEQVYSDGGYWEKVSNLVYTITTVQAVEIHRAKLVGRPIILKLDDNIFLNHVGGYKFIGTEAAIDTMNPVYLEVTSGSVTSSNFKKNVFYYDNNGTKTLANTYDENTTYYVKKFNAKTNLIEWIGYISSDLSEAFCTDNKYYPISITRRILETSDMPT